ncbi:MAG: GHMP kinase [bacterium]|nr:GHMP kinase [bacterium]
MSLSSQKRKFFGPGRAVYQASAPGRLDVMGGIADYSGGYVLQTTIAQRTSVDLALREDGILRVHSAAASRAGHAAEVETPVAAIAPPRKGDPWAHAHKALNSDPHTAWAAYIFGCAVCLMIETGVKLSGADFWIDAEVPIGKGVSSSAALEVAVMTALCEALGLRLPGNQTPILAQRVENRIVGAPCGLMDQLATCFGREGKLLPILCRPDRVGAPLAIPRGVHFIGVDSGVRHSVGGASYGEVRAAAFMAYTVIARELGASRRAVQTARRAGERDGLPFGGYLTGVAPSRWLRDFAGLVPERIRGAEFTRRFGETIDPITEPKSSRTYAPRACAAHPVFEQHRVQQFEMLLQLLNAPKTAKTVRAECLQQMGELMFQAHEGYNACGLGSPATDELVKRGLDAGPEQGVYGAKITGGGSGGAVCFLCEGARGRRAVNRIAREYAAAHDCEAVLFQGGGGEGAHWTPVRRVQT